jgi:hypothetical protein
VILIDVRRVLGVWEAGWHIEVSEDRVLVRWRSIEYQIDKDHELAVSVCLVSQQKR